MAIELNKGQKEGTKKLKKWWKNQTKQVIEVSGPAGSGKTTIIYHVIDELGLDRNEDVLFVSYVGKAVLVMIVNGNKRASTIHHAIYDIKEIQDKTPEGDIKKSIQFILKKKLEYNVKLIILDEGSMVPDFIGYDLLSFGVSIIVLGDIDQLPPPFGKPLFLNNPDIYLTEVMRQAKGDPIIHLSEMIRQGKDIPIGKYGPRCFVIGRNDMTDNMLKLSDVVICGRNSTRYDLNNYIRENIHHRYGDYPQINDRLICRKNNWLLTIDDIPLVNGMVGTVINPVDKNSGEKNVFSIDFQPDFMVENYYYNIPADYKYLNSTTVSGKKFIDKFNIGNKFEYGYAITGHSSQGSQYNKVLVIEEHIGDKNFHKKWLYTVETRAKSMLILVKE